MKRAYSIVQIEDRLQGLLSCTYDLLDAKFLPQVVSLMKEVDN